MAEQEACTELVEKASQEQSGGAIEGESLLLPLLQGLLEAPENEQTADSGTESGEDQRSGLIAEVQCALDKLSASLRSDATDITPERRCSLLQLVTKLQAGLSTPSPKLERRLSSGPGRFGKRKQRQNRHTVGVSSEELADARRLMEEISLRGEITPSQSETKVTVLQKQNSESSVTSNSSSFNKFNTKIPVKNAIAKPFSSSNSNISNTSSSVQTPTDPAENLELLFTEAPTYHEAAPILTVDKKSNYAVTQSSSVSSLERGKKPKTISAAASVDSTHEIDIKSVHQAVQQAAARKKGTSESTQESETEEDDTNTVTAPKEIKETPPQSPLLENPIYSHPAENSESNLSYEEKCNRFNTQSKKLKMKRANTIDIPKSLNFYEDEDDSDCSENEDENQRRKNNYYALRGPIRVSDPVNKSSVPVFEPKTQSDQKFLSFINKNSQNTENKGSLWAGKSNITSVWGNKFGNIKNNFEKASSGASNNSARNFWKTADDAVSAGSVTQFGPKISRKSARNLQQMFEEKQRQTQDQQQNIVTGSLTLKTEPEKNYKFVPQPLPVNQFSHAPQSAFKPIQKKVQPKPDSLVIEPNTEIMKTEIKENKNDAPLYLYSPKPIFNSQNNSVASSPVTSKPWIANATEHGGRVLSMAAKKFEAPTQQETLIIKPRKLSKDIAKVFIPQAPAEKLSAPYLVRNAEQRSNTVRKLSDQYDNFGNKVPEYSTHSTVRYQPPQEKKYHYVPKYNIPQDMQQSYKASQNTAPTYQSNTAYTQHNSTAPKPTTFSQPISPQHTPPSQQLISNTPPSFPTQNQLYSSSVKYDQQQFTPTQYYQTPHIQQPPENFNQNKPYHTQSFNRGHQYQPQNYNVRYDQQSQLSPQSYQQTFTPPQEFQPVNYSITYDKPRTTTQQQNQHVPVKETHNNMLQATVQPPQQIYQHVPAKETQIDTLEAPVQPPQQIYQHVPGKEISTEPVEEEYTSTCQFTPQLTKPDRKPQNQVPVQIIEPVVQPPKLETQISNDSVHEYTAISSRVMTGPVGQQAVTVRQKSPMNRNEHDMEAAFNLRNSLQKVGKPEVNTSKSPNSSLNNKSSEPQAASQNASFKYQTSEPQAQAVLPNNSLNYQPSQPKAVSPQNSFKYPPSEPKATSPNGGFRHQSREPKPISPNDSFKYRTSEPKTISPNRYNPAELQNVSPKNYSKYNPNDVPKPTVRPSSFKFKTAEEPLRNKPTSNESKTFGVVKPIQQKPMQPKPIYNNVSTRMPNSQSRESLEINEKGQSVVTSKFHIPVINVNKASAPNTPTTAQVLSKSDSWHQICMANQTPNKPSPRGSPTGVVRSKSSHTLAVPQKQFEAGITKEELVQKRRTVEAFFSGGNKSPQPTESIKGDSKVVKRSINRIKTSEKASAYRQSTGLCRSRTLPDIICPDLLDESNVDKAFDDLFKSSS